MIIYIIKYISLYIIKNCITVSITIVKIRDAKDKGIMTKKNILEKT